MLRTSAISAVVKSAFDRTAAKNYMVQVCNRDPVAITSIKEEKNVIRGLVLKIKTFCNGELVSKVKNYSQQRLVSKKKKCPQ